MAKSTGRVRPVRVSLIVVAALPVVVHWGAIQNHWALDGGEVTSILRVRIVDGQGRCCQFCCVRWTELWLDRRKVKPQSVFVTDEISRHEIDAKMAFFVRSLVVTNLTTGNRCHMFQHKSDAESHARAGRGIILTGPERPFSILDNEE